jgi:hypothetical protein
MIGEAVKGIVAAVVGAILFFVGQQWLNSDLEYKVVSHDGYLSAPLGEQGLTFSYEGKPLKNVSLVEFGIYNRTSKQFNDVELIFSINDPKEQFQLVSGGVLAPNGIPRADVIEELPTKGPHAKIFRIKVIPSQKDGEYFHAIFVFDGEKTPSMSVASLTKNASVVEYNEKKDEAKVFFSVVGAVVIFFGVFSLLASFVDYFAVPRNHRRTVEKFMKHASEMKKEGKLKPDNVDAVVVAGEIYISFTRPNPSKFWAKIFGEQNFEY